jgi:predicted DsbA family dithiol-disulfide isomerase
MARISIKFFMDYICEYCFLGFHTLQTLKKEYDFDVEYMLLEIHPDTPKEGATMDWHMRDLGAGVREDGTQEDVTEHRAYWVSTLNQIAAPLGIVIPNKNLFANTRNALLAGQYAKQVGKGEEFTRAIWDYYMLGMHDISSREAVETVAEGVGIPRAELAAAFEDPIYRAELLANQQLQLAFGTDRVPCFVVNNEFLIVGNKPLDTWRQLFGELLSRPEA